MLSIDLISLHLSGKSASRLIEAIMDELPPIDSIRKSLQRELPKGAKVTYNEEDNAFIIEKGNNTENRYILIETVLFYERAYPEIDFILK